MTRLTSLISNELAALLQECTALAVAQDDPPHTQVLQRSEHQRGSHDAIMCGVLAPAAAVARSEARARA